MSSFAEKAFEASPTTSMSGSARRQLESRRRAVAESSTTSTRVLGSAGTIKPSRIG
jgi:hypothetical protein